MYAVAGPDAASWLSANELRGIAGGRVRAVAAAGLSAAVSDVPAAEFDQAPLDVNVRDSDWLAPHAEAHQRVNAALLDATGAVIPLAFGTIFRAEDRVGRVLEARSETLAGALASVADRAEWVCTLERDRRIAVEHVQRSRERSRSAVPPGRAYLLRRKAEVEGTQELRALDHEAAAGLRGALASVSEELTDEPLIEGGPALRATVLVRRDREDALREAVGGYASTWSPRGYTPQLIGPWPAYRYGARLGALGDA